MFSVASGSRYDQFRKKFDPVYMNSSAGGGTGVVINWPDDVGIGATAAAADDDDDLHPRPSLSRFCSGVT